MNSFKMNKQSEPLDIKKHQHQIKIIRIPNTISGKQLVEAIVIPIVKGVVIGIVAVIDRFAFTANDNDRIKLFYDNSRSTFASKTIISSICKWRVKEKIEKELKKMRKVLARTDLISQILKSQFSHQIAESLAASATTSATASSAGRR